jgi:opacity protein-like surface antigen
MKKFIVAAILGVAVLLVSASPAKAQYSYDDRDGHFQLGLIFPAVYFGNKNIDLMMSGAIEGEYFVHNNVPIGIRLEDATDFKAGDSPHNVFSITVRGRYIFDVDPSWKAYLGMGVGTALLGDSHWAFDLVATNVGGYYQFNDHLSIGADANFHVLIRSNTAFAFSLGPAFRWKF